jgi:streptogramin lyase
MALKNFTQFTPYTVLSSTDNFVGYRVLDEFRTDFNSLTDAISGLLISKGFTPGSSVGIVRRVSFRYTIGSGNNLNAVSGADDFGFTLSYKPTQIEVYRNGAHLAENLDFIASNGTQVTNLSTFSLGDIVEVVALSSTLLTNYAIASGSGIVTSPLFRYSVSPSNTITPGAFVIAGADDFGSVLSFVVPNLEVYLNGSHLVKDMDYGTYASGSSITLGDSVADGDIVEIVSLSANNISEIASITTYIGIQKIQAGKDIIISNFSGTGNVTVSAKPGIRDIKVPDWTTGAHVTNSSTLLQYLSAVAQSNRFTQASAVYVEQYGSFPGGSAYDGGVLAPNGKIYFVPCTATVGRIVDPSDNSVTTYGNFPTPPTGCAYIGGVLAPNGKIYFCPQSATIGAIVDPANNTVTTYGSFPGSGATYDGAIVAPNGKIYFIPQQATVGRIVDTSNNSVTTYGSFPGGGSYVGAVLAPNGKIYLAPYNATIGRFVDPSDNSVTTYGSFPAGGGYVGGVLAPNGKIYFVPYNATVGRFVDPSNNSVTTYGSFPESGAYQGGVLAPNGKIYFSPFGATLGRFVDPTNNTVTTYGSFLGSAAGYDGAVLAPNGKIYFVPHTATVGRVANTLNNNNFNLNVCTNPFFNKN